MNKKHIPGKKNSHKKRIIGLIGDELHFELPIIMLRQIKELARKNNIEIYYFVTQPLKSRKEFYYQANILYNFVSRDILDGLIIMSNLLGAYSCPEDFMEKCRQYEALPRVSLGLELENIPSVLVDNEYGIYSAVSHLIETHHYTRIGFLNGPQLHPEAQARFKAYTRAMQEHNLPVNSALVLQGNFQMSSATQAIKELIEKRQQLPGRDIEALVCANDYMAIGALVEFFQQGYSTPHDIAIIGFDDIINAKCLIPPLSSISNPFDKMTTKAFELLLDLLDGKEVPKTVIIPTEFIPRSSCGCTNKAISNFQLHSGSESLIQSSNNLILQNLNMRVGSISGMNIHIWQDALAFLDAFNGWKEKNLGNTPADDIVRTTYSILVDTADKALKNVSYEEKVQGLGLNMISTLDLHELLEFMSIQLPPLGIRRCYLNLYENAALHNSQGSLIPRWSRMILAFHQEQDHIVREELPPDGLRFETSRLIPPEIIAKYGIMSWIVVALYFRHEQIGFMLLDSEAINETIYYYFRLQISSSLKGVLLLKNYHDHSQKLAEANAQNEKLNKQLKAENLRIKTEMDVARGIQTALLPGNVISIHPDFEIASLMITATEVGGDYFDIALDNQQNLWMGIGDVSGHGLKAGMIMMIAQTAQTTITANYDVTPKDVIIMMNRVLFRNVTNRMEEKQYMTCSILKYLGDGYFQHAGMHLNFLIYRQKSKTCEEIILNGIWLNIVEHIENYTENFQFRLGIGDVLVLYTDGITEVFNKARELLDIQGLKKIIIRHGDKNIDSMLEATIEEVKSWNTDKDRDDMSLVLVRRIR